MLWMEGGEMAPLRAGDGAREANLEKGFNSEGGVLIGVMARDFKSSTMLFSGAGVLPIDRDDACLNAGGRPPKSCVAFAPTSRA